MTKDKLKNSGENPILAKRKKVLNALAKEAVSSDDDNITDGMYISSIIANQHKSQTDSYSLRALGETIRKTLLEISEVREEIRERRHQELLHLLTKLIQQESTPLSEAVNTSKINPSTEVGKYAECSPANIISVEEGFVEIEDFPIREVPNFINNLTTAKTETVTNKTNNNTKRATGYSYSNLKLPNSEASKQQTKSSYNTVRFEDSRKELQIMRARMLEYQRKKMEDREKKKAKLPNNI